MSHYFVCFLFQLGNIIAKTNFLSIPYQVRSHPILRKEDRGEEGWEWGHTKLLHGARGMQSLCCVVCFLPKQFKVIWYIAQNCVSHPCATYGTSVADRVSHIADIILGIIVRPKKRSFRRNNRDTETG